MTFTPRAASMSPIIGTLFVTFMTGTWLLFTTSTLRDRVRINGSFDDNCPVIELSRPTGAARPDRLSLHQTAVTRPFGANSTQCWDVNLQGFEGEGVVVAVTAAGRLAGHQLAQLTAALVDDSEEPDTAVVIQPLADDIPRATWYYVMSNGQRTRILLANAATGTLPTLSVTFTALRSMAWVGTGSGGPSAADIDVPPPLELNAVFGIVGPTDHMGLADHCILSVHAQNSPGTGDRVIMHLAHRGRIGPGVYDIAGANKPNIVDAVDVPGRVTGAFASNAHAGNLVQDFAFRSGVLEITSISDRLVQGVVRADGWRNPRLTTDYNSRPTGPGELSVVASFAVVANDRGERLASEKRLHRLSYAAIWRRWTHECLQQPPPPFSTADDSDEAEQDPADRPAPDKPAPGDPEPPGQHDPATPGIPPSRFCWKDCVPDDARRGDRVGIHRPEGSIRANAVRSVG